MRCPHYSPAAVLTAVVGVLVIVGVGRWRPKWPGFLIAVTVLTLAAALLHVPLETIGTRFGTIPTELPHLAIPHIPLEGTRELFPSAFTIAFLASVESLLSAVVADGMIGGRYRSNCELIAQSVANAASALFGVFRPQVPYQCTRGRPFPARRDLSCTVSTHLHAAAGTVATLH
ncbi:MAG: SulP family inorganic anion transporter, partial [Terriglobales bacterium]